MWQHLQNGTDLLKDTAAITKEDIYYKKDYNKANLEQF